MKTAMQELIDEFRHLCYDKDFHLGLNGIKVTQEIIDGLKKKYLEKEKEQMLDFGLYVKKNGWVGCNIEDLYEDYNNQNK